MEHAEEGAEGGGARTAMQMRSHSMLCIASHSLRCVHIASIVSTARAFSFSVHVHPFIQTCYSEMDALFKLARTILPAEFARVPAESTKKKYCVELIRRGNHSQMDRMKIIDTLAGLVPAEAGFTVDLKNPDIVILVEILGVRARARTCTSE
jgi:adenylyl- and sulfurtransferase ThiI